MSRRRRARPGRGAVVGALGLLGAVVAGAPAGCTGTGERPHLILVTIDTLRADHVSAYADDAPPTPHLDRLADGGALFEAAYTDASWTTAAMAAVLTGSSPDRHGLRTFYHRLSDEARTVAEVLRERGYRTAAVIGSYALESMYGLDQGFDVYDDEFTRPIWRGLDSDPRELPGRWFDDPRAQRRFHVAKLGHKSRRSDDEVTSAALEHLGELRESGAPFFLWVHYFGPHDRPDRSLHPGVSLRRHVETYDDKVVETDRAVGRFLEALDAAGVAKDSLVIVHSDHGESLGEHDFVGHGRYLYEDNLRVPLLMRWPGRIAAGTRIAHLAATPDLAATLLDAAGVEPSCLRRGWRGALCELPAPLPRALGIAGSPGGYSRSLLPLVLEGTPVREEVYAETYMPATLLFAEEVESDGRRVKVGLRRHALLRPPWKFIATRRQPLLDADDRSGAEASGTGVTGDELYHLAEDPAELEPVGDAASRVRLERALEPHLAVAAEAMREHAPVPLDEEQRRHLRSLGYVE